MRVVEWLDLLLLLWIAFCVGRMVGRMPFPETRDALVRAGYTFENRARCRGCGEEIEWWTTARGRKLPMDLMPVGESAAISHFATCNDAPLFRSPR